GPIGGKGDSDDPALGLACRQRPPWIERTIRADLPHLRRTVGIARDQARRIRAPGDAVDQTVVTVQPVEDGSRSRIPDASGAPAGRGDQLAIRTPGHSPKMRPQATVGPGQSERLLAGLPV